MSSKLVLLPDAGPLITLAYADALDLLFKPRWSVMLVDMVLHEVTRNQTPTSKKLAKWAKSKKLPLVATRTFQHYQQVQGEKAARKANLGELAIQENHWRRRRDSNPGSRFCPDAPLAGVCLRPLGHVSENAAGMLAHGVCRGRSIPD
jgi:hypothetical protein